jgi:hypothetical protein
MGKRSSPSSGQASSSTFAVFFFTVPRKVLCGRGEEDTEDGVNKLELIALDPNEEDPPGDSDNLGENSVSSLVLCRDSPRNSMDLFTHPVECRDYMSLKQPQTLKRPTCRVFSLVKITSCFSQGVHPTWLELIISWNSLARTGNDFYLA